MNKAILFLGEDEWRRLSERDRQLRLMKLKLEAKRLQRENKLDELAKLLGDGFAADVNLRKLLGENREKYEQQLRERLARRRERLAKGLPPDSDDDEEVENAESLDGKSLLESLDKRYVCESYLSNFLFFRKMYQLPMAVRICFIASYLKFHAMCFVDLCGQSIA